MKNLINYYYNLIIKNFKRNVDDFYFQINESKYMFIPFYGNLNDFSDLYSLLVRNNKYCHEVIINREKSFITLYQNKPYILLKKNISLNRQITFDDILNYDAPVYRNYQNNWKNLWKEKIDYYEYQVNQIGSKYRLIRDSFDYYIGMSESAINLLNYIDKNNIKCHICHKRINYKESIDEFLNPINMLVDNRTRDISDYFKINYINENITISEIVNQISLLNLDNNEVLLLLSRLLYPSYYFDIYDEIIQNKVSEDKIEYLIKKNVYYETFLKDIYNYIKLNYKIPEIEWFEN